MALTFDTQEAVQRLRGSLRSRQAAEAQQELVTTSELAMQLALLEKRLLMLLLLQTAVIIGAVAAIEVLVGS